MIIIKSDAEIEAMKASGHVAASVRDGVAAEVRPGVSTIDLADYAEELIRKHGAKSAFKGYRGYPGQICVSVNEAVVHGIPGPERIELGDIVSLDVGVELDGFIGDTATTVMVGVVDREVIRLVNTAREALAAGIREARPGRRLSNVSHAIEKVTEKAGFSVVREFVGHGIGRSMHEDPQVPNFGRKNRGPILRKGMTMAIEPMINMGGSEVEVQPDGWTVLTRDRLPSAHVEHTIVVRDGEAEILTI